MSRLTDPIRLAAFTNALRNWNVVGYVRFELTQTAHQWIRREFDGVTLKDLGRLMHEYVEGGGEIDEVRETRPEWQDEHAFHYDLRFSIQGKPVYLESRLYYREPMVVDDSWILVVNVHTP